MELKLAERLHLVHALPMQGKFEDMVLSKSIKAKIEITASEVEEFEVTSAGSGLTWNKKGTESIVNVLLSEGEKKLIISTLKKLSEDGALPIDLVDLYSSVIPAENA